MNQTNDALSIRRKQLLYRANHRGIKEMDIILGRFARARIARLPERELDRFESLLGEQDHDLLAWFVGQAAVPEKLRTPLFDAIRAFHTGSRKPSRSPIR